jgi:hypothetical protein
MTGDGDGRGKVRTGVTARQSRVRIVEKEGANEGHLPTRGYRMRVEPGRTKKRTK